MPADHYAILVGVKIYPDLGPPKQDLDGPENDVAAVYEWLIRADGGGVPATNIKTYISKDFGAPPQSSPTADQIQDVFFWLVGLANANGGKVGERLYLYFSGHGYARNPRVGCLLTANMRQNRIDANVNALGWLDWLQDANYFREMVCWMDCCTNRSVTIVPRTPPIPPQYGSNPQQIYKYTARAARYNLKAVEKAIPEGGGISHGVFTWNLLQGLRGEAADQNGAVTSNSLTNWLRFAQLQWLDPSERDDPSYAVEPESLDNDTLTFAKNVAPFPLKVTLKRPPGAPTQEVRILGGAPLLEVARVTVGPTGTETRLLPGLYVALDATGLRHGFAVSRQMEVLLEKTGAGLGNAAGPFDLSIDPNDPSAEIAVIDAKQVLVDRSPAKRLGPKLPRGLYQYRIRIGRKFVEETLLLDGDVTLKAAGDGSIVHPASLGPAQHTESIAAESAELLPELPKIVSAAPLPNTAATHEYHEEPARRAWSRPPDVTSGDASAKLLVMSRVYGTAGREADLIPSWRNVIVVDPAGTEIANLGKDHATDVGTSRDPLAACTLQVSPGFYELHFVIGDGQRVAQSLPLVGGQALEAYLLHSARDLTNLPAFTLLMRANDATDWGGENDLLMQKALVALADDRPLAADEYLDLLFEKAHNPLAGIVGAHLLLIEAKKRQRPPPLRLNTLVAKLRELVGFGHPDVEALSLLCSDETLRCATEISAPPIFERSWRLLISESHQSTATASLVSFDLWKRVNAEVSMSPYLCWSTDPALKSAMLNAQAEQVAAATKADEGEGVHSPQEIPELSPGTILGNLGSLGGLLNSLPSLGLNGPIGSVTAGVVLKDLGERLESNQRAADRIQATAARLGLPAAAVSALKEYAPETERHAESANVVREY